MYVCMNEFVYMYIYTHIYIHIYTFFSGKKPTSK